MNSKPEIYTIATAHLDTSWLWKLEQTITEYLPDTLDKNFGFFKKYPEYRFNFEGSYRYELLKEYYPEKYNLLKQYIKEGKWHPCGACYENGDVNIPSPEALIRNILYGKDFFRKEFGIESEDIFLPDCFGFGRALPTVASHCAVKGFSTGKLFWGYSEEIPFDTGLWKGIDGSSIWACLMPFSYTTAFKNMKKADRVTEKLANNKKKGLPDFTFAYHGNGDRGGAPHSSSVKNVIKAQKNNHINDTHVFSATTKEYFDMLDSLPESTKNIMPVHDGEFLLTAHGVGSYTSRTVTKRWNKRCELLADAAERFSCAAFLSGVKDYPQYGFDNAWKKVISHHFHDDITGTSLEECYLRSHNDYVQAMNTFSEEYSSSIKAISDTLDTSFCMGIPVIVSNPVDSVNTRKEAVSVIVKSEKLHFTVFDKNNKALVCQTKILSDNEREITFIAEVSSIGLEVYDIREAENEPSFDTGLRISTAEIENNYVLAKIDTNGDICSVFDKRIQKELLKEPIRLQILNNVHSFDWPAWEIKYEDCKNEPYMFPSSPEIKIRDNGPALVSLEIIRYAGKSVFTQLVSLDCASPFIRIFNETDWREEASLLKASFNFNTKNEYADYDIGCGSTKRKTNSPKLYEVPAQKWAGICDENDNLSVAVFSDSRQGWDKPDESTLRLTLIHTPMANYRWECSQHIMDMGLNRYSYGIMGHKDDTDDVSLYADRFCQPMDAFVTEKHPGTIGNSFSFVDTSSDSVRISAVKKAQNSDRIIIRFTETGGRDQKNIYVNFSYPVVKAFEVAGDETEIKEIELSDGKLCFDIGHNSIKSFAIEFDKNIFICNQKSIELNYNAIGITKDSDTEKSTLRNCISIPRELIPDNFSFSGVRYTFSQNEKNCVICDGSQIETDGNYTTLHLLAASLEGDKDTDFYIDGNKFTVKIPDCKEALGHWDLMQLQQTGYIKNIPQAISFSHCHTKKGNSVAQQLYLFNIELPVKNKKTITLAKDNSIVIYSAVLTKDKYNFDKTGRHFDSLEKRPFDYTFSSYANKLMRPNKAEAFLDRFIDRSYSIAVKAGEFYNKYSIGELYYILRNLSNKLHYKKNVKMLIDKRNNSDK